MPDVLCPNCVSLRPVLDNTASPFVCDNCGFEFSVSIEKKESGSSGRAKRTSSDTASLSRSRTIDESAGPAARSMEETTLRTIGRFELKAVLGRGGFGVVYRAYDPHLERFVALKIPTLGPNQKTKISRFLSEAKAAARLKHANIVSTFESGYVDNKYYIASEFIEGSLLSILIRKKRPTTHESVLMAQKLAKALGYAHSQGIVHRDVKPHNVIIDTDGEPQLMDFGLAKRLDDNSNVTTDGALLGTPAYMSPEQARGEIALVGPASDQYSLGVVLYHLLTGSTPCEGSPHLVISEVAKGELYSVRDVDPAIDSDIAAVCQKAMSPDITSRYATCEDFAEDLANVLAGRPVKAQPLGMIQRARRIVAMNQLVVWFSSLCAVLVLVSVGFAFKIVQLQRSESAAEYAVDKASGPSQSEVSMPTQPPENSNSNLEASPLDMPTSPKDSKAETDRKNANASKTNVVVRPDIMFEDFEDNTYGNWTASGTAFSGGPYCPLDDKSDHGFRVINSALNGRKLADSCFGSSSPLSVELTGTLVSPPFKIDRNYINFWLAGGEADACLAILRVNGKVVLSVASENEAWVLRPFAWKVAEFQTQTATFELVDNSTDLLGGRICVDSIVFSDIDQSAARTERDSEQILRSSIEWNGRHYYFAPMKANYREANQQAERVGGHLLCIESAEEAMFISQHCQDLIWLGLENQGEAWLGPENHLYTNGPWNENVEKFSPARALLAHGGEWQTTDARQLAANSYVIEFGPIEIPPSHYSVKNAAESRLAAKLILENLGQVVISTASNVKRIGSKSELPNEDFELTEVYLSKGTRFTPADLELFRELDGIERLEVIDCDTSVLEILKFTTNLREILISGGQHKWNALKHLKPNHALRKVNFGHVNITSREMRPIFDADALEEFGIVGMSVDPSLADLLLKQRGSIFSLWLNAAPGLGPKGIEKLGQLGQLQTLVLWGAGVTDSQLPAIGQLTELKYLQLGFNKGIQGKGLASLAPLTKLTDLSLWDTSLDDEGFRNLPPLPALERLAIGRNAITDVSILRLQDQKALQKLTVSETNVTDAGIRQLESHPSLNRIEAVGSKITRGTLDDMAKRKPSLTTDLP